MNSLVLLRRNAGMVFGAALCVGLGVVTAGCHKGASETASGGVPESVAKLPPVSVTSATVTRASYPRLEPMGGTVAAVRRALVSAQINGIVSRTAVEAGQRVKKGDVVAEISSPEAEASLAAARAELNLAQQDFMRTEQLLVSRSVSREAFDQSKARLEGAKAATVQAETAVGYREVRAPMDGVVRERLVENGEVVAPGKPLLEMEDDTALRLETYIPESWSGNLTMGTEVMVTVDAAQKKMNGTLAEITPVADPMSRTFLVKFDLPPTSGVLSGQFGRAYIPAGSVVKTEVPEKAVRRVGQIESVFVLKDGRAWLRIVRTAQSLSVAETTGPKEGDKASILAGLEEGEAVAVGGGIDLVDGRAVSVH